jgi:hypothetical protein
MHGMRSLERDRCFPRMQECGGGRLNAGGRPALVPSGRAQRDLATVLCATSKRCAIVALYRLGDEDRATERLALHVRAIRGSGAVHG